MKKVSFLVIGLMLALTAVLANTFTVTNNSDQAIKRLLAREKGKKSWGEFNIGRGIAPGKSMTIEWGDSTEGTDCNWTLKAVFADGSESGEAQFDFCEDPDIEFE